MRTKWSWLKMSKYYDYYSVKSSCSGIAAAACDDNTFCSDYGTNDPNSPADLDFVMPANGIPILKVHDDQFINGAWRRTREWVYDKGNSFSTPYLATSALVAIYAYNRGHYLKSGTYSDPTVQVLYELLKNASSGEGKWSLRMGWGYVDLLELFGEALDKGYYDAPSSSPINTFRRL